MQYLVILRLKPDGNPDMLTPLFKPEAAKAWDMMATGLLRSIYYIKGPDGAVLMIEAGDEKKVQAHVGRLPLVAARMVNVEILPLSPFTGFAALYT